MPRARQTRPDPDAAINVAEQPAPRACAGLVVEDDAATVAPGQIRKSELMARIKERSCAEADRILAESGRSTDGCPQVAHWIDYYAQKDAAHVERALTKFAPGARMAASGEEYI